MGEEMRIKVLVALVALLTGTPPADAVSDQSESLATPESFASIADPAARSAAMFVELGKVLTNPRCVNCHPAGDHPRQGELGRLHQPPVERGADGHGLPAMRCSICHQQANFDPAGVPVSRATSATRTLIRISSPITTSLASRASGQPSR